MISRFFNEKKPRIFAHRGFSGRFVENTMEAFHQAAQLTNYIETDVWLSADHKIVVHHDESLERVFQHPALIHQLSSQELRNLGIPFLADVLKKFPDHFFNIELKHNHPQAAAIFHQEVCEAKALDRILLAAENHQVMEQLRKVFPPEVPSGTSGHEGMQFFQWLLQGRLGPPPALNGKALQIPVEFNQHNLADRNLIQAAHQLGLEVHYWTINDSQQIRDLVALGADGIITDFPDVALEALTNE